MTQYDPIERIGIHQVALVFLKYFGWIEREQPISDFGIDMHVEIVDNGIPTGQIIALQIKSGTSYFSEESEQSVIYRGQKKHLDYWLDHSLPTLIVLFEPNSENIYWEFVDSRKIKVLDKGWKMEIRKTNILKDSKNEIAKLYTNPNHYTNYKVNDVSHAGARRITAKILIESSQAKNKFSMMMMIPNIIEKFKKSDYYRNETTKISHSGKLADIVFLFFYDSIQQVDRGLPFCRAIWNDKDCKYPLNPFIPEEVIQENIGIIWDRDNDIFKDFISENEFSKGHYLNISDQLFEDSKLLYDSLQKEFLEYNKNNDFEIFKDSVLFKETELEMVAQNPLLNDGFAPLECQDIDSLISSITSFLHNILLVIKDSSRSENNIVYLVKDYLNEIQGKLNVYEYERKKVT